MVNCGYIHLATGTFWVAFSSEKSIDQLSSELLAGAAGLAGSARRVFRWRAALWWLAVGTAAMLVLIVGDMLLRREELGLRILSLLTWVAVVLWGALRWLKPAWRFTPTPLEVARWIEQRQPGDNQQLSTVVELATLPLNEVRYGSRGFREFALRQWSAQGNTPDWRQYLDTRGLRRAALACAVLLAILVGLLVLWPAETRVALARLSMPWSVNHWPQRDQLAFRNLPTVVAIGSELQVEITDLRPPLPERVELQTRLVGDSGPVPHSALDTIQVGEVAVGNLPTVTSALEVRAVGGDDRNMPWHRIEVVQPPELTEYQFEVQPPDYSRLPQTDVVGQRIAVLAGSQVAFQGRFSESIKRIAIQLLDQPTPEPKQEVWSARIGSDGRELQIGGPTGMPLTIQQSLNWQLSIVTAGGLEMRLPERWRIEVTQDAPPLVALQSTDMAELSADAQLAVRGIVNDDLGLAEVVARLQVEGVEDTQPSSLSIWNTELNSESSTVHSESLRELSIDTVWNISQVAGLVVGQRIVVWLEARDSAGQWGRSELHEYAIRDSNDLVDSIQRRQNQLLAKVRELVDTQRRNSQLFSRADEVSRQSDRIEREQLDLFRNVAGVQRALLQQFQDGGQSNGLTKEISRLRELLTQNRLEQTELAQELSALQDKITELGTGPLQIATRTSEESLRAAQALHTNQDAPSSALANANELTADAQSVALRGLESLLDRLARNEAVQQVQHELAQILNQQNALRRETDQLQLERLSTLNADELEAKQTALSADQQGLARRLDDLVRRAEGLQTTAGADQQSLKTQLERATQSLNSSQASAMMRRSTEEIRSERFAQAAMTQQEVAQLLSETLQQLGAGNSSQFGSLQNRADSLRQTGQELSQLAQEQTNLAEQWNGRNAGRDKEQLLREQSTLQDRTRFQANTAEQAGNASLSSEIESAADDQQAAHQSGEQQNFQLASAAGRRAAEQLEQSAERLQQRAEELDQQVAEQQISALNADVEQLAAEQRTITGQFNELSRPTEEDHEDQQVEIRGVASRQEAVRQTLRDIRNQTTKLPTFDWTLEQAEGSMSRAVAAAQRYRVRPDANEAAEEALRLLELAAAAMQSETPERGAHSDQQEDANSGEQNGQTTQSRPIPIIASLKLLRSLQQEINSRTIAAEASSDSVRRSQKLNELSVMQQALGKQIEQLLREFAAANDTGSQ